MLCRQFNGPKKNHNTKPILLQLFYSFSLVRAHHFNNLNVKKSSHDDTKTSHSDWACSRSPRAPVQIKRPLFYLQRNYLIIFTITTNYLRSQGNENLDSSWTNMPSFELHPFVLPMLSLSVITVRFCWTSPCSSKNTSYPRIPEKKRERDRHLWIREKLDLMKERDKNKQLVKIQL